MKGLILILFGGLVNYFFRHIFKNAFVDCIVIYFLRCLRCRLCCRGGMSIAFSATIFVVLGSLATRGATSTIAVGASGFSVFCWAHPTKIIRIKKKIVCFMKSFTLNLLQRTINHRTDWNSPNDCFAKIVSFQ